MNRSEIPKSATELLAHVANEQGMKDFLAAPLPILATLAAQERRLELAHNDRFIYRTVVITLALLVFLVAGVETLSFANVFVAKPSDYLIALGSTALGALAGLLAPVPNNRQA
jgi:hypothetical protein